jgi:hypothetical protein
LSIEALRPKPFAAHARVLHSVRFAHQPDAVPKVGKPSGEQGGESASEPLSNSPAKSSATSSPKPTAKKGRVRQLWDFLRHHNNVKEETCPVKEKASLFKLGALLWASVLSTIGGVTLLERLDSNPIAVASQHIEASFKAHETLLHLEDPSAVPSQAVLAPHAFAHLKNVLNELARHASHDSLTKDEMMTLLKTGLEQPLTDAESVLLSDILGSAEQSQPTGLHALKKEPVQAFGRFVDELLIPRLNLPQEDGAEMAQTLKTIAQKEFGMFPKQKAQHLLLYTLIAICLYVGVKGGLLTASMKTKRYSGGLEAALLFPLAIAKKTYNFLDPLWSEPVKKPSES